MVKVESKKKKRKVAAAVEADGAELSVPKMKVAKKQKKVAAPIVEEVIAPSKEKVAKKEKKASSDVPGEKVKTSGVPPLLEKFLRHPAPAVQLDNLCQGIGWGFKVEYEQEAAGWVAEITCGLGDQLRFVAEMPRVRSKAGEKAGRTAVSIKAIEGLKARAVAALSETPVPLEDAFGSKFSGEIVDSTPEAWSKLSGALSKAEGAGRAVGIGTAGNSSDKSEYPAMVQVSTPNFVIIEFPRASPEGKLSKQLELLLGDSEIIKVFCTGRDLQSVQLPPTAPGVVNLEKIAVEHFGPTSGFRGIARIAGLTMGRSIEKPGTAEEWKEIERQCGSAENGGSPATLAEFSEKALQMVSVKAWATVLSWQAMQAASEKSKIVSRDSSEAAAMGKVESKKKKRKVAAAVEADGADGDGGDLDGIDEEIEALESELLALEGAGEAEAEPATSAKKTKQKRKKASSEEKPTNQAEKKASKAARPWLGFRRMLDGELRDAGGALPWKSLGERLAVRRAKKLGRRNKKGIVPTEEELGLRALAGIPREYLNKRDGFVRLP